MENAKFKHFLSAVNSLAFLPSIRLKSKLFCCYDSGLTYEKLKLCARCFSTCPPTFNYLRMHHLINVCVCVYVWVCMQSTLGGIQDDEVLFSRNSFFSMCLHYNTKNQKNVKKGSYGFPWAPSTETKNFHKNWNPLACHGRDSVGRAGPGIKD